MKFTSLGNLAETNFGFIFYISVGLSVSGDEQIIE